MHGNSSTHKENLSITEKNITKVADSSADVNSSKKNEFKSPLKNNGHDHLNGTSTRDSSIELIDLENDDDHTVPKTSKKVKSVTNTPKKASKKSKRNQSGKTKTSKNSKKSHATTDKPDRKRNRNKKPLTKEKPVSKTKNVANSASPSSNNSTQLKHPVPLLMQRTRIVGPVVRISRNDEKKKTKRLTTVNGTAPSVEFSIVNKEQKDSKPSSGSSNMQDSIPNWSKNRVTKLYNHMTEIQKNPNTEWTCSLCHCGSLANTMGDLYGPYHVVLNVIPPVIPSSSTRANESTKAISKTKKRPNSRTQSLPNTQLQQPKAESVEVWLHEDCVVWSNATFVAGRLDNLEEVIEDARRTFCFHCCQSGATLSCAERSCTLRALHFPCARQLGCFFDEQRLSLLCPNHIGTYLQNRMSTNPTAFQGLSWPQRYLNFH